MTSRAYVLYDTVAEESGPIQLCKNDGVALRMVEQAVGKTGRAHEFHLWFIGTYDHELMAFEAVRPERVQASLSTPVEDGADG